MIKYIAILTRALWWLIFGLHRGKLRKVWGLYKIGGLRLCWYCMMDRFHAREIPYDSIRNQLSDLQGTYILEKCPFKPLFSIVVPVYKVNRKWLEKCIGSVVNQYYKNWEMILVDDASQQDDLYRLMKGWALRDNRIRCFYLEKNTGIAEATNIGIKQAHGQYIAFLDHDDELTPDALTWVAWALNKNPDTLWFYSDEDLISPGGKCHSPRFKPDFSPEYLLSNMFTCHLSIYSAEILHKAAGIRLGFDGSQDHDLALRLSEIVARDKVVHIPRVLYHWRQIPGSAATYIGAKPKAPSAGRRAVAEALQRRDIKGKVTSYELCPTIYQIELDPSEYPRVSIIIPTKNSLELVKKCIDSVVEHTRYPKFEIVVINNGSDNIEFLDYIRKEESENRIKTVHYNKPFNHSEMNNIAVASVESEFVLFMNNDVEILTEKWLEQLVATAQIDDSIAAVGGLLLYPNGTVQDAGIILGIGGAMGHAHKYILGKLPGYNGRLQSLQEISVIAASMMLMRRSAFEDIHGFDSKRYPIGYNDIDLCMRLRKRGYRCVYNPRVKAIHYETKTRSLNLGEWVYKKSFMDDYAELLNCDPFYNPNLSLNNEQFRGFRDFSVEDQIPELANIAREPS